MTRNAAVAREFVTNDREIIKSVDIIHPMKSSKMRVRRGCLFMGLCKDDRVERQPVLTEVSMRQKCNPADEQP